MNKQNVTVKPFNEFHTYKEWMAKPASLKRSAILSSFCKRMWGELISEHAQQRSTDLKRESYERNYRDLKADADRWAMTKRKSADCNKRTRANANHSYKDLMDYFDPDVNTGKTCGGTVYVNDANGLLQTQLDQKTYLVSRLVYMKFHGDFLPNGFEVMHLGDKLDNRLSNLRLVTRQQNMQHAADEDLMAYGETHWKCKLSHKQIDEIRAKYNPHHYTQPMLAEEYGVGQPNINAIIQNVTWNKQ